MPRRAHRGHRTRAQIARNALHQVVQCLGGKLEPALLCAKPHRLSAPGLVEIVNVVHDARAGPGTPIVEPPPDVPRRRRRREYQAAARFGRLVEQAEERPLPVQIACDRLGIVDAQHPAARIPAERLRREPRRTIQREIRCSLARLCAYGLQQMRLAAVFAAPQPERIAARPPERRHQLGILAGRETGEDRMGSWANAERKLFHVRPERSAGTPERRALASRSADSPYRRT